MICLTGDKYWKFAVFLYVQRENIVFTCIRNVFLRRKNVFEKKTKTIDN